MIVWLATLLTGPGKKLFVRTASLYATDQLRVVEPEKRQQNSSKPPPRLA
jgi:hypothetical protein